MNIDIKTKFEASINLEAVKHSEYGGGLKSHNCELGEWWGEESCEEINLSKEISQYLLSLIHI